MSALSREAEAEQAFDALELKLLRKYGAVTHACDQCHEPLDADSVVAVYSHALKRTLRVHDGSCHVAMALSIGTLGRAEAERGEVQR